VDVQTVAVAMASLLIVRMGIVKQTKENSGGWAMRKRKRDRSAGNAKETHTATDWQCIAAVLVLV